MALGQCEILSEEQKDLHHNENFYFCYQKCLNVSSNICVRLCFAPLGLLVVSGHK